MNSIVDWRLPAEWEPQSGVVLAWPHAGTDWAERLDEIERSYTALVAAIAEFEPVLVLTADASVQARAAALLRDATVPETALRWLSCAYDDTWLRDSGPICLTGSAGVRLLDFHFTAWGGKYAASQDDRLVSALAQSGQLQFASHHRLDFALEGGAIDSDGEGSILSTWACLSARHAGASREHLEQALCKSLHAQRVMWLEHGAIEGDDTDAHIDTLARFAPGGAIVYQACDDPSDPHHAPLGAMAEELAALRRLDGSPYRLHALPWAQAVLDPQTGRRLAASYANYLIVNGAVICPVYDDPADELALQIIASAYPGRAIRAVPARPLIWQNGSVHCLTMQLPAGVLR